MAIGQPSLFSAPAGETSSGKPASGESPGWQTRVRSRGTLVLIGALGLGVIGAKLFWPQPPKLVTVSAATSPPKITKPANLSGSAAAQERAGAKADAVALRPEAVEKPPKVVVAKADAAQATANPDGESRPAPAVAVAPAQRVQAKPKGARVLGAAGIAGVAARAGDPLGAIFIDETNGYSVRFPAGWSIRTFAGEPWVLDCGDGKSGLISVGFSPFPTGFSTDNIPPEWIAKRIKRRSDTTLHGQGYATVGGRRALWSKSTGPLPMSHAKPRMTRVNYILPTGDGRVLELRVAAAPEQFDRLVPLMKKAVDSFRLMPPHAAGRDAVATAQ